MDIEEIRKKIEQGFVKGGEVDEKHSKLSDQHKDGEHMHGHHHADDSESHLDVDE